MKSLKRKWMRLNYSIAIALAVFFIGISKVGYAQNLNDSILIRINGNEITLGQFVEAYRKNNVNIQDATPLSPEEYLELFVNFQLKVKQARSLGMDTTQAFKEELATYREQLAQNFLNDRAVTDHLIQEAYQRMQYDIRASHIVVSVNRHAQPADTLAAWNRISEARNRILAGEPFEVVAVEVSDDPSVREQPATQNRPNIPGNKGDLGYFTVFEMVYPFETAAFQTPVGNVSEPFRTDFGYHILYITDRLPAMGRARVAHIMKIASSTADSTTQATAFNNITKLHQRLIAGESFDTLATRYSEDRGSSVHQGQLPPFTSSRMVPEFIKAISQLSQPGQISEPVRSSFGWHILRLIEKTPPPPFENIVGDITFRLQNDMRSNLSTQAVVDRFKKANQFVENKTTLRSFAATADSLILAGNTQALMPHQLVQPLFVYAGQTFNVAHFADFIAQNPTINPTESIEYAVLDKYSRWVEQSILNHENSNLEKNNLEFRKIFQEFHDGILLFELKSKRVWSRALTDTIGLRQFFDQNSHLFQWPKRLHATVYQFADRRQANTARRIIQTALQQNGNQQQWELLINDSIFNGLQVQQGTFAPNQNPIVDNIRWREGVSQVRNLPNGYALVLVHEVLQPIAKQWNDARGYAVTEYQTYLENQWINELRNQFKVSVNRQLLRKVR